MNLCCKRNTCDIALMLRDSCYSITCASEELCEEVPAPSSNFYPRLSYVRRDIEGHGKKGADHFNCLLRFVTVTEVSYYFSSVRSNVTCDTVMSLAKCRILHATCPALVNCVYFVLFCFVFFFSLFFEPCFIWFLT